MKILVVDDDPDQLTVRTMLLKTVGFDVVAAVDSPSALELAAAERPDCAIVDLCLPTQKCGLRLIRQLKKFDRDLPIFVLTGVNPDKIQTLPERSLMDAVIGKGSSTGDLIQRLKKLRTDLRKQSRQEVLNS